MESSTGPGKWAYLFIALAAALWGGISLFVKGLSAQGFTAFEIVSIRVAVTLLLFLGYLAAAKKTSLLKIRLADLKYFIGTGVFSIIFFNWCYFAALRETSVAVAAILLYTAPAFVVVLSRFFFKERLTGKKILALLSTFAGCVLVTGAFPLTHAGISLYGLLLGLGSGLGYALYSIFGKFALEVYPALTVTAYTFLCATVAALPFSGLWEKGSLFLNPDVALLSLGLGLIPTVLAYMLYTVGLKFVEPGRAAITATLEPIVAALVGTLFFHEAISVSQFFGIVLIVAAVIAVQNKL